MATKRCRRMVGLQNEMVRRILSVSIRKKLNRERSVVDTIKAKNTAVWSYTSNGGQSSSEVSRAGDS